VKHTLSKVFFFLSFHPKSSSVATQEYVTETHNVYVILGNSALLKCQIPIFVSDFVTVESWSDDKGNQFLADIKDYGNCSLVSKCFV
jgi:hypothetical protein